MSAPGLPINLTAAALDQKDSQESAVLVCPDVRCDRVGGSTLQVADEASAVEAEVYLVVAGYGALRCADGSAMDVTAGDLIYVPRGASRSFGPISRTFSALRLSLLRREVTDLG